MDKQRLIGVQTGRGVAALLVAVYHACRMMALPQYSGHKGFGGLFEFGYSGVDFFFVLSGFIIFFVHREDLGRPDRFVRYGWRRLTRIYPNYWLVLTVVIGMAAVGHHDSLAPLHVFRSIFLLPDVGEPILGVAWTLVHEMLFYSVFALGILNLRIGIFAGTLWLVMIATHAWGLQAPLFRTAAALVNIEFLLGIVAAKAVLSYRIPLAPWIAVGGATAFVAVAVAENSGQLAWASSLSHLLFGLCSLAIIVGVAAAERQGSLKVWAIGEHLGGASYLLYLVHTVVIGFVLKGFTFLGYVKAAPDGILVATAVASSVFVAMILYRYFDLPTQATLNRLGRRFVYSRVGV